MVLISIMKTCIFGAHLIVLPLVMGASSSTFAATTLPDVFVTASRSDQAIELAPIGATVISGEEILNSGVSDANEAIRLLGGVFGRQDLNGGREAVLDLRGFGDASANNVVVLVDGVRISENEISGARLSGISPEMIDRIEILRGSSSVLWGDGASSGVINVITKAGRLTSGNHGQATLRAESFGGRDVRADVQTVNDTVSFSAQARSYQTDGYRKNSKHSDDAVNLSVGFGDQKTLKTRISFFSEDLSMRWPGALPIAVFLTHPTETNTPNDFGAQKQERWTISLEKQFDGVQVAMDVARRNRKASSFQDYGFSYTEANRSESVSYQVSPRVSWTKDWGNFVASTVIGVDWNQWDYDRTSDFSGFVSEEKGHQISRAAYARTDIAFSQGWRVNAGLRSEKFSGNINDLASGLTKKSDPSLTAFELGLSRAFSTSWSAHARLSSSYRVANIDELRYLIDPLEPQKARDLELGLRYREGATSYGVRLFEQRTKNEIAYDNNVFANINLDPVRRTGIEFEGSRQLTRQFRVAAVAQVIKAKLSDGAYGGNDLPLAPRSTVLIRTTYDMAPAHAIDMVIRSVGSAPFGNDWTNTCANSIPHTNFIDFGYRYKATGDKGWSAFLGVDNVMDKQSYSVGYTNSACSAYNVYPDAGQRVKASASYRF